LASHDTVSELMRVLAYPKFKLTRYEQETLLGEFLPYIETVRIASNADGLPEIRDKDDIIFLVLAAVGLADALVTGDGDILAVREQFHVPIFTIAEFADWFDPRA
jgi:putative PIN family toxin of toxin-antitoxin system